MARPTKSRALYAQMAGRATRPADAIAHELNDHDSHEARRALLEASNKPGCLIVDFVGNSGRHKLCTSVDILGGNITEHARELAVRRLSGGKPVRVDEAIVDAQAAEREEQAREEAKRARLLARARFTAKNVDPFDLFDVSPKRERAWDNGKALSAGQAKVLRSCGIDPETLSYSNARQILNQVFTTRRDNCTDDSPMVFGKKYQGKRCKDVPDSFWSWWLDTVDAPSQEQYYPALRAYAIQRVRPQQRGAA